MSSGSILDRYRHSSSGDVPSRPETGRGGNDRGAPRGLSNARNRPVAPIRSDRTSPGRPESPRRPVRAGGDRRTTGAGDAPRRAREATRSLRELAARNPKLAREIDGAGRALAAGTRVGLNAGISVALGVSGIGAGGYWDEGGHYIGYWNNYGAHTGFGYGWGHGGYAFNGWNHPFSYPLYYWYGFWPRYSYWYPRYYAPYYSAPVYYSTAVASYIITEPEPEVVYVEAEPEPVLVGEGVAAAPRVDPELDMGSEENAARATGQYLTLGDQAFRDSRYADAVHFYARAVQFSPEDAVLWLVLSDGLFATGDYHYGAFALRKALELDETLASNSIDKHDFYSDPSDFDSQLAVLEGYVIDHMDDGDAILMLAANYLFGGRPAAAVDLLAGDGGTDVRATPAGESLLAAAREIQYGK